MDRDTLIATVQAHVDDGLLKRASLTFAVDTVDIEPTPVPVIPAPTFTQAPKLVTSGIHKGKYELRWTKVDGATYVITRDGVQEGVSTNEDHYAKGGGKVYGVYAVKGDLKSAESTWAVEAPAPAPVPPPEIVVGNTDITIGTGGIATTLADGIKLASPGATLRLRRSESFVAPGWIVPADVLIADFGRIDAPEPLITFNGKEWGVLFDATGTGCKLRNLRVASNSNTATAVQVNAASVGIENLTLVGSNWIYGIKLKSKCRTLRVKGFGGDEKIRGTWMYDNGDGEASDIVIDLDGRRIPGSLEENVFRTHCKKFTLRNGTIAAPATTKGIKTPLTVQDGSEDVTVEDLTIEEGGFGIGAIMTSAGWQDRPVRHVTFRRIRNLNARDTVIQNGAYYVTFEDCDEWHHPSTKRGVFRFETDNPNFDDKPTLLVRNFHSTGPGPFLQSADRGDVTLENVTHNGKAPSR